MRRVLASVSALMICACSFAQIHLGLFDDFQDLTTQGWTGPNVSNIPTGGPTGAGDAYLQITADGGGQGGKLAGYNTGDWIGDWQAAGVTNVTMMLMNPNSVQLEMRIVLFDAVSHARWTSSTPSIIAPNSGWTSATFSVAQADLTEVLGTSSYQSLISNVERFMIRHDAGTASSGGTNITGSVGIDNIRAVPEPATFAALGLGLMALRRRRK